MAPSIKFTKSAMFAMAGVLTVFGLPARPAVAEQTVAIARNGEARLRVFSDGSGPAIVLLPSLGRGPQDLDGLTRHLVAAGYHVIRPEPRGFGESTGPIENVNMRDMAKDVAAAIEVTGSAPAVVAGWAYGNRVARMLATEWPDLTRGVVLIAAGGNVQPAPEVVAGLKIYADPRQPLEVRAEMGRKYLFGPKFQITTEDMQIDATSMETVKAQTSASPAIPLEYWGGGGKGPMLVVQGLSDVVAPPENGRGLAREYPDRVTLVELPDLGHSLAIERPDLVGDAIIKWLKDLGR